MSAFRSMCANTRILYVLFNKLSIFDIQCQLFFCTIHRLHIIYTHVSWRSPDSVRSLLINGLQNINHINICLLTCEVHYTFIATLLPWRLQPPRTNTSTSAFRPCMRLLPSIFRRFSETRDLWAFCYCSMHATHTMIWERVQYTTQCVYVRTAYLYVFAQDSKKICEKAIR